MIEGRCVKLNGVAFWSANCEACRMGTAAVVAVGAVGTVGSVLLSTVSTAQSLTLSIRIGIRKES